MTAPLDLDQLSGPARKVLSNDAPPPMRMMAAKGVIPGAKPGDLVTVAAALTRDDDPKVAQTAEGTLRNLPPPVLGGALSADLDAFVIERLAEAYAADHDVVEQLLRMPRIGAAALEQLAQRADERLGELIATNEQRLLHSPTVIEKLYMNKNVRMSTSDRLLELAVRNGLELNIPAFKEAAAAIQNELVAEPTEEPAYDDVLFNETDALARQMELEIAHDDTHDVDDEGKEIVKAEFEPLQMRIAQMTVSQKIRKAMLGSSSERLMLLRDPNRLVAAAAAQSPLMNESEAARVTASRNVSEDVLRIIARNREFTRHYQIKINLVTNPRTPFSFASRLIPHLREHDLKSLSKSKNITGAVSQAVKQQLARKRSGSGRD